MREQEDLSCLIAKSALFFVRVSRERVRKERGGARGGERFFLGARNIETRRTRERKRRRSARWHFSLARARALENERTRRGLVQSRTSWKLRARAPLEPRIRCRAAARLTRRDDEPRVVRDPARAARLRSPSPAATRPREGCWRNSRAFPTFEGCRDTSFFLDADEVLPRARPPPPPSVRSDYLFKLLVRPPRACRPVTARAARAATRLGPESRGNLGSTFGYSHSVFPSPRQLIGDSGVGKSCLLLRFAVRILRIYPSHSVRCERDRAGRALTLPPPCRRMTRTRTATSRPSAWTSCVPSRLPSPLLTTGPSARVAKSGSREVDGKAVSPRRTARPRRHASRAPPSRRRATRRGSRSAARASRGAGPASRLSADSKSVIRLRKSLRDGFFFFRREDGRSERALSPLLLTALVNLSHALFALETNRKSARSSWRARP
jgi:hypothetical protein